MRFLSDSFLYFLKLAVFENILNSVGDNLFKVGDSNSNGVVEEGEFKYTLIMLGMPQNMLRFYPRPGFLDFGEYLVAFEIFVRKALFRYCQLQYP